MKKIKQYTLVTFLLSDETVSRYFEGNPTFDQIRLLIGGCTIIDIQKIKGNFEADYKRDAKRFGGYYVV